MEYTMIGMTIGWFVRSPPPPSPFFPFFLHFRGTNLFGTCPLGGSEVDLQSAKSIQQVRTKNYKTRFSVFYFCVSPLFKGAGSPVIFFESFKTIF